MLTSTDDAAGCFRLDASLCDVIGANIGRGRAFRASDAWTLLGLWSLADHGAVISAIKWKGAHAARFAFRRAELLDEMRFPRCRQRGAGVGDFPGKAWEAIGSSLTRLATAEIAFHYSTRLASVPAARGRSRYGKRPFRGTLIALHPPENGTAGERVTLAIYEGVLSRFYVWIRRRLFDLRPELSELEARLVLWLVRWHRGAKDKTDGRVRHRWDASLSVTGLVRARVLVLRRDHPGEAREQLLRACIHLAALGVLQECEHRGRDLHVVLSRRFFHVEQEAAA